MTEKKTPATTVKWEAEEYITHDKNAGWYIGLAIVGIALVALSIWLQWWTFTALVVLCVVFLNVTILD